MSPSPNVFFLFCAAVVNGVVLPGGCPQVPASHESYINKSLHQELILVVSFTNPSTTYLFKDINIENIKSYQIYVEKIYNHVLIDLSITNSVPYPYYSRSHLPFQRHTEVIHLTSIIFRIKEFNSVPSKCYDLLHEDVRIWLDGDFVIIWSCRENSMLDHEEALILVALHKDPLYSFYGHSKEYLQMMKSLNGTVRKYLQEPLLNKINWAPELDFRDFFL